MIRSYNQTKGNKGPRRVFTAKAFLLLFVHLSQSLLHSTLQLLIAIATPPMGAFLCSGIGARAAEFSEFDSFGRSASKSMSTTSLTTAK
jgi:hypothetical protein